MGMTTARSPSSLPSMKGRHADHQFEPYLPRAKMPMNECIAGLDAACGVSAPVMTHPPLIAKYAPAEL